MIRIPFSDVNGKDLYLTDNDENKIYTLKNELDDTILEIKISYSAYNGIKYIIVDKLIISHTVSSNDIAGSLFRVLCIEHMNYMFYRSSYIVDLMSEYWSIISKDDVSMTNIDLTIRNKVLMKNDAYVSSDKDNLKLIII